MVSSPVSVLFDRYGSEITTVSGVDGVRLGTSIDGEVGIDSANTGGLALDTTVSGAAQTLSEIESKDFATETTLSNIDQNVTSLEGKDFAKETTLSGVAQTVSNLESKDFATETTLSNVDQNIGLLEGKDFSSETTLSGVAQTLTNIDSKDFATETTLSSLESKDFSTETTLSGAAATLSSLEAKDFATESTLSTVATETTASGINITLSDIRDKDGIKKIQDPLPVGDNQIGRFKLTDGTDVVDIVVDSVASLNRLAIEGKVFVVAPEPPDASSPVVLASDTPLSITTTSENSFTIPDGETFYLQTVSVGAEGDPTEKGSRIEVIFDENGTEHLVTRIYITGFTVFQSYNDISTARDGTVMVGSGSLNSVILRRVRLSGSAQEVDAELRGYTQ